MQICHGLISKEKSFYLQLKLAIVVKISTAQEQESEMTFHFTAKEFTY